MAFETLELKNEHVFLKERAMIKSFIIEEKYEEALAKLKSIIYGTIDPKIEASI